MKNNISNNINCFGCGVCAAICPQGIISIGLNENGFYKPSILNETDCVHCGLCTDVCSFSHKDLAVQTKPIKSWAAWSDNTRIRQKCSSGGIGFEIGKQLIEKGYKAIGCRYDTNKQRAEHFIAYTVKEYIQSIGSKYIQSYTEEAFKKINFTQKYLITGTPCQIDSIRRMVQKHHCEDNFILMDFYCHCVPSMLVWKAYVKMLEPKIGNITYASWRNKYEYGWHDSWLMGLDGDKKQKPVTINQDNDYVSLLEEKKCEFQSRLTQGDLFYRLFLGDVCMGPQCEKDCKYKYDKSSADIRIGDLWGNTYKNDEKGVSALVAFTERGTSVIKSLTNITLVEHPFETVAEGQMKQNARHKVTTPLVMCLLKHDCSLSGVLFRNTLFFQRFISKLNSYLK